jgi:hypothetical protein
MHTHILTQVRAVTAGVLDDHETRCNQIDTYYIGTEFQDKKENNSDLDKTFSKKERKKEERERSCCNRYQAN